MEKKIEKWLNNGIIDKNTANILLEDIKKDKEQLRKTRTNITIYTIAVIFLGIGILTFISSNDWILQLLNSIDLIKILLMVLATFSSMWGGYKLAYENKKLPKLGNALFILSSLLIGGLYALIGQIYNINANNSSLMFLWLLSILPLAYIFKNNVINIISVILFILGYCFYYMELDIDHAEVWTIYIPLILGTGLYTLGNIPLIKDKFNQFSIIYKVIGSIPIFITILILTCSVEQTYYLTSAFYIIPTIFLIILNLIIYIFHKKKETLLKLETSFLLSLLIFVLLILNTINVNPTLVTILANIGLLLIISFGFNYGYKFENEKIIGTTNFLLLIYIITNYCRWGWSFMDKALFFILGGLLLLSLGFYLEKKKKQINKKDF